MQPAEVDCIEVVPQPVLLDLRLAETLQLLHATCGHCLRERAAGSDTPGCWFGYSWPVAVLNAAVPFKRGARTLPEFKILGLLEKRKNVFGWQGSHRGDTSREQHCCAALFRWLTEAFRAPRTGNRKKGVAQTCPMLRVSAVYHGKLPITHESCSPCAA